MGEVLKEGKILNTNIEIVELDWFDALKPF